jgi:hypothetical protein
MLSIKKDQLQEKWSALKDTIQNSSAYNTDNMGKLFVMVFAFNIAYNTAFNRSDLIGKADSRLLLNP